MLRLVDQEHSFPFVGEQADAQGQMRALGYCVKKTPFTLRLEAQLPPGATDDAQASRGPVCALLAGGVEVQKRGQEAPVSIVARALDSPAGTLRWNVETRVHTLSSQQESHDLVLRFTLRYGRGQGPFPSPSRPLPLPIVLPSSLLSSWNPQFSSPLDR